MRQPSSRHTSRGVTLVEIMVSLAIGLVVVGAVFANYLNNAAGARQAAALAQVTEDATLALGILRNHLAMADYSQPTGTTATGLARRLDGQITLLGCETGFDTKTDNTANATDIGCAAGTSSADALLVRYEADSDVLPTVTNSATGQPGPMDCRGYAIPQATGGTHFIADNRFFVDTNKSPPTLSCIGNGGIKDDATPFLSAQPLVENVLEMHILYGLSQTDAATNRLNNSVYRYVTASKIGLPPFSSNPNLIDAWSHVASVRICVLVRSAEDVLDQPRPYRNCAGSVTTPAKTDRRIYRAFTTTVVLNNRVSTPASVSTP